jgi:ribosomal protein S18 acetylase RimI-like enzyme
MNIEYVVRKSTENDKKNIAKTIAYSFEKDFSTLINDMEWIANILENGINTDCFYVAEQSNGKIIGVITCTDCIGRAVNVNKTDCKKQLGFIRGLIGYNVFYDELMRPLDYPETTGNIEIVGVLSEARGKGIAKAMLMEVIKNNIKYNEFVLDVTDTNISAQKCYTVSGFVEFKRKPVKFAKQKGFNSKIFMKYTKNNMTKK